MEGIGISLTPLYVKCRFCDGLMMRQDTLEGYCPGCAKLILARLTATELADIRKRDACQVHLFSPQDSEERKGY